MELAARRFGEGRVQVMQVAITETNCGHPVSRRSSVNMSRPSLSLILDQRRRAAAAPSLTSAPGSNSAARTGSGKRSCERRFQSWALGLGDRLWPVPRDARENAMTDADIGYRSVLPEGWPRPRGFSHAVVATGTTTIRVAGQLAREGRADPGLTSASANSGALCALADPGEGRRRPGRPARTFPTSCFSAPSSPTWQSSNAGRPPWRRRGWRRWAGISRP